MSLFDHDLIQKNIDIFDNIDIFKNCLTYKGKLPPQIDSSGLLDLDNRFWLDPFDGSIYYKY